MNVIMIGGPYDGEIKDAPTTGEFPPLPLPFYNLIPPMQLLETPIDGGLAPNGAIDISTYKLKEIWQNGRFQHYEYHYLDK